MVEAARTFAGSDIDIQGIIFDFSGNVVFDSDVSEIKYLGIGEFRNWMNWMFKESAKICVICGWGLKQT